jgi:hypothetical protein
MGKKEIKKNKYKKKTNLRISVSKKKILRKEILEKYYEQESRFKRFFKILLFISIEIFVIISIIFILILLYRTISKKQIDDVNPLIECNKELLAKADVYYVIPKYKNISIADNPEWCNYILSLNKTLRLHGIYHTYGEFGTDRNEEYVQEGLGIFEKCFGYKPTNFRPPQLDINDFNKKLIKKMGLTLDSYFNCNTHKVYHCNDTGIEKNNYVDLL